MAVDATIKRRASWERANTNLTNLNQRLIGCQPRDRDALERAIAEQEDELLDLPAPSFTCIRQKLEIMWETELHGLDRASEEKRLLLKDLSDLIAETHQLLGLAA